MLATLPDPNLYSSIGWATVIMGSIFVIINQGASLVDRLKSKPAPADVRAESLDKFATKVDLQQAVLKNDQEHNNVWSKIGGMERGLKEEIDLKVTGVSRELVEMERRLNKSDEERTSRVHDRLDNIFAEVAEMRGAMTGKPTASNK